MKEDNVLSLNANAASAAEPGAAMSGQPTPEVTNADILASILESLDDMKARLALYSAYISSRKVFPFASKTTAMRSDAN